MDDFFHYLLPTSHDWTIIYITYFIHMFRFYFYCSFQENIRCMPGYYEKKSETLYNDNVEIKYF